MKKARLSATFFLFNQEARSLPHGCRAVGLCETLTGGAGAREAKPSDTTENVRDPRRGGHPTCPAASKFCKQLEDGCTLSGDNIQTEPTLHLVSHLLDGTIEPSPRHPAQKHNCDTMICKYYPCLRPALSTARKKKCSHTYSLCPKKRVQ